jgi:MHS family proline/betaine transporter-like MFS transporter
MMEIQSDKPPDDTEGYSLEEITVTDASALTGTARGTVIGNFTEWYDFGVYSFVIPMLSAQFFEPMGWGNVATFAGLAVSFVFRPLGGIFWGFIGDRIGRKNTLALTVLVMASGTLGVGLLPGYAALGLLAPALLFIARAVQGFSTGGEYVGAITYLTEYAPDKTRGYLLSFVPVGTLSGYVFGAVFVTVLEVLLPTDAMYSWGWRLPFLLAGPLAVAGLLIRLRLEESPVYEQQSEKEGMRTQSGKEQFKATVVDQWRPLLVCAGLVLSFNVTNYMLTGYMPTYMREDSGLPKIAAMVIIIVVILIQAIIVRPLGRLSDRVGRKPIMIAGSAMLAIISFPMFVLILQGDDWAGFFGVLPMGLMLVCFMSTEPSVLPTLFPTNVRYGATAIGYNFSVSAFGGMTPLVASVLGGLFIPAYMLIAAGLIGLVAIYFTPEPAGKPLPGTGPVVASEEEARQIARGGREQEAPGH